MRAARAITSPASPVPFRRAMRFAYGRCDKLSPLVRRVIARNPGPFTLHGTGTYIVGRGEVAVIDPGPKLPRHVDAILAALDPSEKISHILVTHSHADHSPAAALLRARCGAPICGMPLKRRAAASGLDGGVDQDFKPDMALKHKQILRAPSWTLECLHTPGHLGNHFCFALKQEKLLFCGDLVMGWATPIIAPPDGRLDDYLRSLALLLTRKDVRYWPAHGPHIDAPQRFVRAVRAHRQWRNQSILTCLKAGPLQAAQLVKKIYADITPKLHGPAARTLQAHLDYLLAQKKIRRIAAGKQRGAAEPFYGLAASASR